MPAEQQWGGFQRPVGSSNETLRVALVNLIDRLNGIKPAQTSEIATISNSVADLATTVEELQVGGGLTPQEEFELALDHAIDTIQGSRAEWQVYVEDQIRKLADSVLQIGRYQQDDTAAIITEQTVRVNEREAFAQQVDAITADIASSNAAILTEQTARATGDAANASSISTLTTTVGGNTTSINSLTTSVNGISAQWGVSVSTNGNIIGAATLSGSQNVSTFSVVANRFSFATSDNGTPTPFFTSGTVNGTATSVFTGTLIGDGTIIGRHILAGSVTTATLAVGAVTADRINVSSLAAVSANFGNAAFSGYADSTVQVGGQPALRIDFSTPRIRMLSA